MVSDDFGLDQTRTGIFAFNRDYLKDRKNINLKKIFSSSCINHISAGFQLSLFPILNSS